MPFEDGPTGASGPGARLRAGIAISGSPPKRRQVGAGHRCESLGFGAGEQVRRAEFWRRATQVGREFSTRLLDLNGCDRLPRADVVVAADMLYDTATAQLLGRLARDAVAEGNATVIVTCPGREAGRRAFLSAYGGPAAKGAFVHHEPSEELLNFGDGLLGGAHKNLGVAQLGRT
eukprot:scaffold48_cov311-Pinguiococcus_pyrenoidosus.AAC.23